MKIFIEKLMVPYDPSVYTSTGEVPGVAGWDAVDVDAVAGYEEAGFLLVRDAVPRQLVEAAVRELEGMREADDPGCQTVYFEGLMRGRLGLPSFDPQLPDTPAIVVYAPLAATPVDPDVVLFWGSPGKVMLLQEMATRAGVAAQLSTLGRPTCVVVPTAISHGVVASTGMR